MSGVGLAYQGKALYLDPDFQIDWETQQELLDFEQLGEGSSFTISIPIKGNEHIFGFASDAASSVNRFTTYDDFAITWGGNVWWECSLVLENVSDDGLYYEGTLSTISSAVFDAKDTSIREVLDDTTFYMPLTNGDFSDLTYGFNHYPAPFYNGHNFGDVCFPRLYFYQREIKPATGLLADLATAAIFNRENSFLLPVFRLKYVVESVLKKLGYTLRDNYSTPQNQLRKLCIINNRVMDSTYDATLSSSGYLKHIFESNNHLVKRYVPELTVYELLSELAIWTGSSIVVDPEHKTICFNQLLRSLSPQAQSTPVITNKHSNNIRPKGIDAVDFQVSFDNVDDDELQSRYPEDLAGNYIGTYETVGDFTIYAGAGDYAYITRLNAYYKAFEDEEGNISSTGIYADAGTLSTSRSASNKLSSKLLPVQMTEHTYKRYVGDFEITDNGSGKVRITGDLIGFKCKYDGGATFAVALDFKESSSTPVYFHGPYDDSVHSIQTLPDDNTVDLFTEYKEDISIAEIVIRNPPAYEWLGSDDNNYFKGEEIFPMIGGEYHWPERSIENDEFAGRILIFHGMQPSKSDSHDYAFGSSGDRCFDSELSPFALGFSDQAKSLYRMVYEPVKNILSQAKAVVFTSYFNADFIRRFQNVHQQMIYQKGKLLWTKFKVLLTPKGIRDQEIEGYDF